MYKNFIVLFFVFYIITCMGTVDSYSIPATVNLNSPGVLEKLRYENPGHYQKIQEILAGLYNHPESTVPHWIQTKFNARDVLYGPVLLTSLPPQKHISFTLDNIHYKALITLTDSKPLIFTGE